MPNFLEDLVGPDYAPAAFWAIIALAIIVAFLVGLALLRRARAGTYVAGGRNRKARLAIMDAAAVDTHRRLVLVRRDDVEHLLLIGGNSDIVVERDIRASGQVRRMPPPDLAVGEPEAAPVTAPRPVAPAATAILAPRPAPSVAPAARPVAPPQRPTPASTAASRLAPAPRPVSQPRNELDDDLMKELESALDMDDSVPVVTPPKAAPSLDDEMAKLLGDLTSHKR